MLQKINSFIKIFFSIKIKFKKPKSSKIVLFHADGKELLNKYIKEKIVILDPLKEIYFIVLLKSLLDFSFKNLLLNYNKNFILMTNPRFVFTYIDNDLKFYFLKNFFKNTTFVAIQNGYRGTINDKKYKKNFVDSMECFNSLVPKVEKLNCDFILTFNKAISARYKKFINTKTIVIGSIKNNSIKKKKCISKRTLSFIPTISINKHFAKKIYFSNKEFTLSLNDWLLAEKKIIPFLAEFCKKNDLKFQIIPKGNGKYEKNFYKNLIKEKSSCTILNKQKPLQAYEMVDKSNYLVSIGSSLAYEALSRKKKVAFLAIKKDILKKKGFKLDFRQLDFGWPSKFKKKGYFWTHQDDLKEFERVLNFITKVSDQKWLKIVNNFRNDFNIPYNINNSMFTIF